MYSDRYVAFVDLLGFSSIVRQSEHDQTSKRFDALVGALTEIGSHHPSLNASDDFQFQSFSDSVVMSSAPTPTGLVQILSSISDLAIRLLKTSLLIRGAIAKGKLYHKQPVIFGPALLDAYSSEVNIAKFPRIVISREVYEDFQKIAGGMKLPQVLLAEDGPPYLHVFAKFRMLNEAAPTPEFLDSEEVRETQLCRAAIQILLDGSIYQPSHYEKLLWLSIYWNSTVVSQATGGTLKPILAPVSRRALDEQRMLIR
jgi:hypothetical protein